MNSAIARALPFPTELASKLSVRITPGDAALVDRLSTEHGATRSAVVRAAVARGLVALSAEIDEQQTA